MMKYGNINSSSAVFINDYSMVNFFYNKERAMNFSRTSFDSNFFFGFLKISPFQKQFGS